VAIKKAMMNRVTWL